MLRRCRPGSAFARARRLRRGFRAGRLRHGLVGFAAASGCSRLRHGLGGLRPAFAAFARLSRLRRLRGWLRPSVASAWRQCRPDPRHSCVGPGMTASTASTASVAATGRSRTTLLAGLPPSSKPLNAAWRTIPSRVQPPSSARITISGLTQTTRQLAAPAPLVVLRRRRIERRVLDLQPGEPLTQRLARLRVEARADLAGEVELLLLAVALVVADHERAEVLRARPRPASSRRRRAPAPAGP